jgi:outer membrane protein insertion porin family
MKRLFFGLCLGLLGHASLTHASIFQVSDIRIEGLQRVSAGKVFAALPISVGDILDQSSISDASRSIFKTGFFDDVSFIKEGEVLVIELKERPAISEINLEGNKAIQTEQLMEALTDNGLAEGQIFRQSILDAMAQELQRQYVSQGRYGAKVVSNVVNLPRNRVAIDIVIDEGKVAKIRHINIIGNKSFTEKELRADFEQKETGFWSFFSGNNKYSKEKLTGDIENLEAWYLDRGYLAFKVKSTQVSVSADKKSVFITITIDEGSIYRISDIELSGELKIPEKNIRSLILVQKGMIFSQALLTTSNELITRLYGNEGYTFAKVESFTELDKEKNTSKIIFVLSPGMRTYVRRIEFMGNTKTIDEVLRREMRQWESAPASNILIESSKVRLERLGFFKEVNLEKIPVLDHNDQIDLLFDVEEQPSGAIGASFGYAQGFGTTLGVSMSENNFLGTGRRVVFGVNESAYRNSINLSYMEPYFTSDGVSVGYSIFQKDTDYEKIKVSNFSSNSSGFDVNWTYPITDVSRIGFGLGYETLAIQRGLSPSQEIVNFLDANGENDIFDIIDFNFNYKRSTLNKGIFATRGSFQRLALEASIPESDLEYFKFTYEGKYLKGLTSSLSLSLRSELGFGKSYGQTTELPFFKNFYGGGFGSVRGFSSNSLGPRDTPCSGSSVNCANATNPIGGNVKVNFGADIIFPTPFVKDKRSMQSAFFIDSGNIFSTTCRKSQLNCSLPNLSNLRYSMGVGVVWLSAMGPLTFSYAKPFNVSAYDEIEMFQFSLGTQI